MKTTFVLIAAGILLLFKPAEARSQSGNYSALSQEYTFTSNMAAEIQYYIVHADMTTYAMNGEPAGATALTVYITAEPADGGSGEGYDYICRRIALADGDAPEVTVPSLEEWTYLSTAELVGIDDRQQVFGIEHDRFDNLTDSGGAVIAQENAYNIYNMFIEFHSIVSLLSKPSEIGAGIQDLHRIGQRIVHATAHLDAPLHFGDMFADGSHSRNGNTTLTFKGLSAVDNTACAVIGYDSGMVTLTMNMEPYPDMVVITTGIVHSTRDIYRDIDSQCVKQAVGKEFVVTETTLPFSPDVIRNVTLRNSLIENVSQSRFDAEIAALDGTVTRVGMNKHPTDCTLHPNSPNPFNAATTISYTLTRPDNIRLDIFNISGQRVATLADGPAGAGTHSVAWNGRNDYDAPVASGIYFYCLTTSGTMLEKKMMLLK